MKSLQFAIFLLLSSQTLFAQTIYVSPNGNDNNSGLYRKAKPYSKDGPLATLDGARIAVARQRNAGKLTGPVHVKFANGEYSLWKPVIFGPADSGTKESHVIYEADTLTASSTGEEAKVVFNSGIPVKMAALGGNGLWHFEVPPGTPEFDQFFVNERRAIPDKSPSKHWFYMTGKYKPDQDHPIANPSGRAFCVPTDVFKLLRALSPAELSRATIVVYHSWEISRHHIESLDDAQKAIILKGPGAPWAFMEWGAVQRFHVEGIAGAEPLPGMWSRPNGKTISYWPLPKENYKKVDARIPACEQTLIIMGTAQHKVEYLSFVGLAFRNTGFLLPPEGHSDGQAAASIPAVFQVDHASNINIQGCEIAHTGDYGVWFREGCSDCKLERSYLHDLGAGGVRIGETTIRPVGPSRTHHIVVDNNIIHQSGRIFMGSIGIWIGQSGSNQVTHNDISDTYYTGISDGWTWGYGEALTQDNHIDFNHIHHIGQGVLSDMGGVYTLGDHRGSTVNNNVIHDVYSYDKYGRGGWGLYTDEGTTGITMANNLVYNVKTGLFHQHYGRENLIKNNILVNSMDGQLQRSRVEDHLSFTFEHNIVQWAESPLFSGSWKDRNVSLHHNIYWNSAGKPITFEGMNFDEWQKTGKDQGSLITDPMFVDATKHDFRFMPNSPVIKTGFVPFDYSKAGVYGAKHWILLPGSLSFPMVEFQQ